jgi:hypothetical protein
LGVAPCAWEPAGSSPPEWLPRAASAAPTCAGRTPSAAPSWASRAAGAARPPRRRARRVHRLPCPCPCPGLGTVTAAEADGQADATRGSRVTCRLRSSRYAIRCVVRSSYRAPLRYPLRRPVILSRAVPLTPPACRPQNTHVGFFVSIVTRGLAPESLLYPLVLVRV